jgi:dienelactone hydrolase
MSQPVSHIRAVLQTAVTRPQTVDLAPQLLSESIDGDVAWETWEIYTESGALGRCRVLLGKQANMMTVRRPVIFFLHGTGSSAEGMRKHLIRYARLGFLAVSIDSRYHGTRGSISDYHAALVAAWEGSGEHPFMYDTVHDLMKTLDFLLQRDDVDGSRIGTTGISLGGMHSWFFAAADTRVAAAAPMIGVQGYRHMLENELWQARVGTISPVFEAAAKELGHAEINSEVVRAVWEKICPGLLSDLDAAHTLRCIAPRPLLVVNGEIDPRCPLEGVTEAFEAAREEYVATGAADKIRCVVQLDYVLFRLSSETPASPTPSPWGKPLYRPGNCPCYHSTDVGCNRFVLCCALDRGGLGQR